MWGSWKWFVGQSSETKQLFGDQILNFGPDFLKTGELWSTYFGIFEKVWDGSTRPQNFMNQSSKTKQSYYQNQILNFGQDSCYVMRQKP